MPRCRQFPWVLLSQKLFLTPAAPRCTATPSNRQQPMAHQPLHLPRASSMWYLEGGAAKSLKKLMKSQDNGTLDDRGCWWRISVVRWLPIAVAKPLAPFGVGMQLSSDPFRPLRSFRRYVQAEQSSEHQRGGCCLWPE